MGLSGQMHEIFSETVLLMPALKSVIPNELFIIRLRNNRHLRLEVADFVVQLLADMLSAQFIRTG